MNGVFITIEGVEGCGKTTQIARLGDLLASKGYNVLLTREPGGTALAERIRELLLDPSNHAMSPLTELLLYEAARAQHVEERIRPALEAGAVVLCDRFADSTTAYQGAGRNLPRETVLALHRIATAGVWPDLTIVIDVPAAEGLRRASRVRRQDRIEGEPQAFHERVRECFLELARQEPHRVRVVDGMQSPDAVADAIAVLVAGFLDNRSAGR